MIENHLNPQITEEQRKAAEEMCESIRPFLNHCGYMIPDEKLDRIFAKTLVPAISSLLHSAILKERQEAQERMGRVRSAIEKMQTTERIDEALVKGGKVHHDYRRGYKWGAFDALAAFDEEMKKGRV